MKKSLLLIFFTVTACIAFGQQDFMTVLPDSTGREMFSDFLGVRLWGADYKLNTLNQDLTFKYVSANTGYVMQHDFNTTNLNSTANFGLGLEENAGAHLLIHFVDISIGYNRNVLNWNLGAGIGYFEAFGRKQNFRIRASLDLFYENINYGLGSYSDTTGLGLVINGNNIGGYVNGVKYVDNCFCASLGISFLYRSKELDFFAGANWLTTLIRTEDINFYYTNVNLYQAVYTQTGYPVGGNIIKLGNYMLQFGIMREFGL